LAHLAATADACAMENLLRAGLPFGLVRSLPYQG
jgi:hypothetical protein